MFEEFYRLVLKTYRDVKKKAILEKEMIVYAHLNFNLNVPPQTLEIHFKYSEIVAEKFNMMDKGTSVNNDFLSIFSRH